jgi:threonine synthase
MDIQISSNFERLLFEALERDPEAVRSLMARLNQAGAFDLSAETLRSIGSVFASATSGETESAETIRETLAATGEVLDPHSAVGYAAARRLAGRNPMVTLATAHPAKFPDAVEHAAGIRPDLPHHLSGLMTAPERFKVIPNNPEAVKAHIREQITAAGR